MPDPWRFPTVGKAGAGGPAPPPARRVGVREEENKTAKWGWGMPALWRSPTVGKAGQEARPTGLALSGAGLLACFLCVGRRVVGEPVVPAAPTSSTATSGAPAILPAPHRRPCRC